jgi:hypothetical protein
MHTSAQIKHINIKEIYSCIIPRDKLTQSQPKPMSASFMNRFVFAPIIFIIVVNVISFIVNMTEIKDSMYYIVLAIMSLPLFLYMVMG